MSLDGFNLHAAVTVCADDDRARERIVRYCARLSHRLHVPKNYMFIGTPGDRFPFRIEKLGGVRVVL